MFQQALMMGGAGGGSGSGISLVGTSVGGGTTNLPAGLQSGDYVVVQTSSDNAIVSAITGWDLLKEGTTTGRGGLFVKRMTSTPDGSIVVPSEFAVVCMAFRAVHASAPQDVPAQMAVATGAGQAVPNPPAITPITNGCAIIISAALDDHDVGGSVTAPAGFGDVISSSAGTEVSTAMMAWALQDTAALIDPAEFGTEVDAYMAVTQALRPA